MRRLIFRAKSGGTEEKVADATHWHRAESYPEWWIERSKLLLGLLAASDKTRLVTTFSEYGCGPHKPFLKALSEANDPRICHALDLKPWDGGVIEANLDSDSYNGFPASSCGVLSGVVEYLRDPAAAFEKLAGLHSFLLLSYCYSDLTATGPKDAALAVRRLSARAARGWRNHYSLHDVVAKTQRFGYVCDALHWRDQLLLLLARHGD